MSDLSSAPSSSPSGAPSGLALRLISAFVLGIPVLAAVYFGSPYYEAVVLIAGVILLSEWRRITVGAGNPWSWQLAGLLYIGAFCFGLVWLRITVDGGRDIVFWLLAVVWSADSGAYLVGRTLGGPKMAPRISPKKTWSGLIGGVVLSGAIGYLMVQALADPTEHSWAQIVVVIAISAGVGWVAEMGDLLESAIKRHFDVKDAGTLIPGHGGLFDRVDGLMASTIVSAGLVWLQIEGYVSWL